MNVTPLWNSRRHSASFAGSCFLIGLMTWGLGSITTCTWVHDIACVQVLLETALEAPDEVAADLSMLSNDERAQLLGSFNATDAHAPADKTLSQLFEAQAAAQPQAECLMDGGKKLTYAEVSKNTYWDNFAQGRGCCACQPSIMQVGCRLIAW